MIKDFIYHREEFVRPEHCKDFIDFFEKHPEYQCEGTLGSSNKVDERYKKCTEMYFKEEEGVWVFELLKNILEPCCNEYKKIYPFLNEVNGWKICSSCKIQKYNPGEGYFKLHCENEGSSGYRSRRLIAWMVYLNDVKEGGYTFFPSQDRKFSPKAGDILMWPAYWTHPHQGVVSETCNKYIITGWYTFISDT